MTNTRDLILKLRAVYKEKKTSYDILLSEMEQNGDFTSKSTLSRLFGNQWEKYTFDYFPLCVNEPEIYLPLKHVK